MLILGIDPSMTATGIALVRFHLVGGVQEILWAQTVRDINCQRLDAAFRRLCLDISIDIVDGVMVEQAFQGEFANAGIDVSAAGWAAGMCAYKWLGGIEPRFILATNWRKWVYGFSCKGKPAEDHCRLWCEQLNGYNPKMSIHACEAVAIAASWQAVPGYRKAPVVQRGASSKAEEAS